MMLNSNFFRIKIACLIMLASGAFSLAEVAIKENKSESTPLRQTIDKAVQEAWAKEKIKAEGICDDSTFLRRIYFDLLGTIPSYDEARKFLADQDEKKRDNLIERLLNDSQFSHQQTTLWDLTLFGRTPPNQDATRNRTLFKQWLEGKFSKNEPFDLWVRDLILAEQEGSELFYAQFNNKPEDLTESFSRIFLGTQIQCARCHDHPFTDLLQKDFYGMTGFFVRLVVMDQGSSGTGEKQVKKLKIGEKNSGEVLFSGNQKELKPGKKGEPIKPKFLSGALLEEPPFPADYKEPEFKSGTKSMPKPLFSRKEKLAQWATAPSNPFFAKAAVNRIWSQFMGRGIVHPVDNFGSDNKPTLPDLLDTLTEQFVAHKFNTKWLIKELVSSQTYQLGSKGENKESLPKHFERARIRPLSAEEILAGMIIAGGDSGQKSEGSTGEYFRRYFGQPTNGLGDFQGSLSEHLFLNNSSNVRAFISRKKGNLADTINLSKEPWEQRIDQMFLSVLTRLPKESEKAKFAAYLQSEPKSENLVEEAIWVLMNSVPAN